jgi:hypothetical protein
MAQKSRCCTYVCRMEVESTKASNPAHEACCAALLLWVWHVSASAVTLSHMFDTPTLSRDGVAGKYEQLCVATSER